MKTLLITAALLAAPVGALAQSGDTETRTTIEAQTPKAVGDNNHQLSLDFVPTVIADGVRGLGVGYQYRLVSNLSLGAFAEYYESKKFEALFSDITWTHAATGIESKYFVSNFGRGFYLGAAATYVYLKGKGTVGTAQNINVEDDADKFGYLAKLGYAFEGNTMSNGSTFIIDFALNYGTGNAFEYSAVSASGAGSMRINEIRDSLGLYGALGIVF